MSGQAFLAGINPRKQAALLLWVIGSTIRSDDALSDLVQAGVIPREQTGIRTMSLHQAVGLAVRLFAIFLAFYVLRYASSLLPEAALAPPNRISLWFIGTFTFFWLLVAGLLWLFPLSVAGNLIPGIEPKRTSSGVGAEGLEQIAFSVMGLWVLTEAIPNVFFWAAFAYRVQSVGAAGLDLPPERLGHLAATGVELLLGFWLLLGSKGIAGLVRRARRAGT